MQVKICETSYNIETKVDNLLAVLGHIKQTQNNSLAFGSGCRSGICGSCAVVVNGVEKLACKTTIKDNDEVTPLKNLPVIKDLVVDNSKQHKLLKIANAQLQELSDEKISNADVDKIDKESNCILCNSCYSSCPVYEVNDKFLSPFALTRAYRYIEDKKEKDVKSIIDNIQDNGVFSCTLCGNCNMVCPAGIDIKGDIMKLQNKSVQFGHTNPNFATFDTGMDFGFNP
ncbi:MAG: succinate dehydrogenase/fumarate reductase iron-sulfur subunit [Arcobacteraceae bacterium]|nr:succinate dehydrogenase/fumarate reductase iron-sulfur subunit [Arcobacteraceae bacterium]